MTCTYCGTRIFEDEHRCRRCGRTPDDPLTGDFHLPHSTGALAAQPVIRPAADPPQPPANGVPLARAVQRSLFPDKTSKVVAFDSYVRPAGRPRTEGKPAKKTTARRTIIDEAQASLDFLAPADSKPRLLDTTVEAMIYCEERVATAPHRLFGAALDVSMVMIAYGLFLGLVQVWAGGIDLDKTNVLILGAVLPLFGFLYGFLWALANTETPGMRWAQLRLTTFEGFRPEARERMLRFAGSCLSMCTVVGLLWSLADEEGLAWQDHISRTFPTPRSADSQVLYRR